MTLEATTTVKQPDLASSDQYQTQIQNREWFGPLQRRRLHGKLLRQQSPSMNAITAASPDRVLVLMMPITPAIKAVV
jgi:hypothetical protein